MTNAPFQAVHMNGGRNRPDGLTAVVIVVKGGVGRGEAVAVHGAGEQIHGEEAQNHGYGQNVEQHKKSFLSTAAP